jgi:hypothetical protein
MCAQPFLVMRLGTRAVCSLRSRRLFSGALDEERRLLWGCQPALHYLQDRLEGLVCNLSSNVVVSFVGRNFKVLRDIVLTRDHLQPNPDNYGCPVLELCTRRTR